MSGVRKTSAGRPLLSELNPHLMCILCGGYYVDAAAIIECLHTFCKSCLVRYLETNKYCPICDVQVHKTRPLQNIRPDPTLQDMVYKLVPGLYQKEMKCRREFYSKNPDAPPTCLEDRGDLPPELCPFYTPDEPVSLVLQYQPPEPEHEAQAAGINEESSNRRFLRCPAAVKITHLEKLLRSKYGLDNRYDIELMLEDSKLPPDLSLMDVAYAFGRKRKEQFLFTYRVYDSQCKKMRLCVEDDQNTAPSLTEQTSQGDENDKGVVKNEIVTTPSETIVSSAELLTVTPISSAASTVTSTGTSASVTPTQPVTAASIPFVTVPVSLSVSQPIVTPTASVTPTAPSLHPAVVASNVAFTSMGKITTTTTTSVTVSVANLNTHTVSASASVTSVVPASAAPISKVPPPQKITNHPQTPSTPVSSTNTSTSTASTPTEGKSKLDSIISRLGDQSKYSKAETVTVNSVTTPTSKQGEVKKSQGKEVQLRISENGIMRFTSMSSPDKDKAEKTIVPSTKSIIPPPAQKPPTKVSQVSQPVKVSQVSQPVKVSQVSQPVKSTENSDTAPKPGAVTPVASPRKPSSTTVGYKTLKSGPKSWNPTISRNSFLSAKLEQQQQQQQKNLVQQKDSAGKVTAEPPKPPRFFKARNTPRYLGNPASGVKPMFQISEPLPVQKASSSPKPQVKPPAVLKIDPRTLTPIMSVPVPPTSTGSGSPTVPAKDRPPFLSTTISGASNHTSTSHSTTTTSSTSTESVYSNTAPKMSAAELALRSSPTLPYPIRYLPYCDPLNPFSPRLGDGGINRVPSPTHFAGLLRPPFPSMLVNSYGGCGPPPVGMLYNQGPLSPVAPSSPKTIFPPAQWAVSPSSPGHQSKVPLPPHTPPSPSPKNTDKQTKVNGKKTVTKEKTEDVPVKSGSEVEKKTVEKSEKPQPIAVSESTKEKKNSVQENNNTVLVDKKPVKSEEPVKSQTPTLSHNISKLCSPTPAGKELSATGVENSPADQLPTVKK